MNSENKVGKGVAAVTFELPQDSSGFFHQLVSFFHEFLSPVQTGFVFTPSHLNFFPQLELSEKAVALPKVTFRSEETIIASIPLQNTTHQNQASPHAYQPLSLGEINKRISELKIIAVDHVGFNLPWFETTTHPLIANLRSILSPLCLYHLSPTGEPWDFILPGTKDEINKNIPVDYSISRKPKLELVSFHKSSTPLIQFDFSLPLKYEQIAQLFPEGIAVPEDKNVWIYLENPYGIDICFVLNQAGEEDWSRSFSKNRI